MLLSARMLLRFVPYASRKSIGRLASPIPRHSVEPASVLVRRFLWVFQEFFKNFFTHLKLCLLNPCVSD